MAEFCSFFFATLGLFLSIVIYELRLAQEKEEIIEDGSLKLAIRVSLIYNMACTIALIISIYIRYDIWLQWSIKVGKYTQFDTLINTGIWKTMVVEMVINAIAPSPFLDGVKYKEFVADYDIEIQYEVNDLLLYFMFNRIYLGIKCCLYVTQFMTPRAQRCCSMNGCDASSMFAIKSLMKQKPYLILIMSLLITTVMFGF